VWGATQVPARVNRSQPDAAGRVGDLCTPQKRLVVDRIDVSRGDRCAFVAGVDAERIALPDVHGGSSDRRAGRGGVDHVENQPQRHAGLALGDVFANASLVQVERAFDLFRVSVHTGCASTRRPTPRQRCRALDCENPHGFFACSCFPLPHGYGPESSEAVSPML